MIRWNRRSMGILMGGKTIYSRRRLLINFFGGLIVDEDHRGDKDRNKDSISASCCNALSRR